MAPTKSPSDATNIFKHHHQHPPQDGETTWCNFYHIFTSKVLSDTSKFTKIPIQGRTFLRFIENNIQLKIYRWATIFSQAPSQYCDFSEWELQEASFFKAKIRILYIYLGTVFLTPTPSSFHCMKKYFHILGPKKPPNLLEEVEKGKLNNIKVREVIRRIEVNPYGKNTYLSRYEEVLIVTKTYMEADHSVSVTHDQLGKFLRSAIKEINPHKSDKTIK